LPKLQVRIKTQLPSYEIRVGRGLLAKSGNVARGCLHTQARRIALVSNKRVFDLYGQMVSQSFHSSGFAVSLWLMGDSERFKTLETAVNVVAFLRKNQIQRTDGVIALGGGVVGDLAGFAAAIHLRGVPFLQIPTTLLAQIDSSVGGKTGVNVSAGKNLIGAFHQPRAVVVDPSTLTTLPPRELVAGWCEAIKHGAVGSRALFHETTKFLESIGSKKILLTPALERLIVAHCAFKASIVKTDEREEVSRRDHHSRRVLNFGHTIGHALEAVTRYRRFRHGEAVGHGMLVAGQISKNLGLLKESELELLRSGVDLCGPLPSANDLDERTIVDAIALDKKRTGKQVQWVLLERIGRARLVDGKEISEQLLKESLRHSLKKQTARSRS
jgi:3-dehydroquinate synthase